MTLGLVIIFSAIGASFFGMLIYRLNSNVALLKPAHSFCPNCQHRLQLGDLIPLLSFIFLRGRCRYCRKPINLYDFLLELVFVSTGVLAVFFKLPLLTVLLSLVLWAVLFSDLQYQEIPYFFMALTAVLAFCNQRLLLLHNINNLIYVLAFFVVLRIVEKIYYKREVFGRADIILFAIFALYYSWPKFLLLIYFSFILGALISLFLVVLKKANGKTIIPFAPFIVVAFFITEYFGDSILKFYGTLF